MSDPVIIAVEGVDGAGKTPFARALAERLGAYYSREPFIEEPHPGCPPACKAYVFIRDRERHLAWMRRNPGVHITDRYHLSTVAYQYTAMSLEEALETEAFHARGVPEPDFYIVLVPTRENGKTRGVPARVKHEYISLELYRALDGRGGTPVLHLYHDGDPLRLVDYTIGILREYVPL